MTIVVACDHAGFAYKTKVIEVARQIGCDVEDLGCHSTDPVDYPDYAQMAGKAIQSGCAERAIILCGSGIGAAMAANKMRGVRAAVCHDPYSAHQGVEHDDVNVMALGARVVAIEDVPNLVSLFLRARFTHEERHVRRMKKIECIEREG
jgi:ribose 5-phosphate isomerase B